MRQPRPVHLAAALALAALAGAALPALADPVVAPGLVPVRDGLARIAPGDLQPLPFTDRARVTLDFAHDINRPVLDKTMDAPGHRLLRRLYATGQAAGNHGDLYENRDRGHSRLPSSNHPQLAHVVYAPALRTEDLDYGLAGPVLFDAPLIGNSSTALTAGPFWRSLPRIALTERPAVRTRRLFQNYMTGQIHVYPGHRDHHPAQGDLFPANTPYYLISQGSSRSDQPHLEALAMILAALRPDTKTLLHRQGLLAPTVQMIFRRAQTPVRTRAAYFSGLAHPSVFEARNINLARMVQLANAIAPDAIPPMVQLAVVSEDVARDGIDHFAIGHDERLFDTPSAIARVWRSKAYSRSMEISAAGTRDPNGRELSFTWALLRGDPSRTQIEEIDGGRRARITVDWQAARPVPTRPELRSHRIDIGVFAHNGVHDSAPAFVSILLPGHETRDYRPGPDGRMRPASIDWRAREGSYADPALFPEIPWRNAFEYDAEGRLTGWTRHGPDGVSRYDAEGVRIDGAETRRGE